MVVGILVATLPITTAFTVHDVYSHCLLYELNEDRHSIFHVVVLYCHADVFALMYELGGSKDRISTHVDRDDNNMLHLACKISTLNWIDDNLYVAPLSMQWEVGGGSLYEICAYCFITFINVFNLV